MSRWIAGNVGAGAVFVLGALAGAGCSGDKGDPGLVGSMGTPGPMGTPGAAGTLGPAGTPGAQGAVGDAGAQGEAGAQGDPGLASRSLSNLGAISGLVAVVSPNQSIPSMVKALVAQYNVNATSTPGFPLAPASTDTVRALKGLQANVVVRWLEPLTWDDSAEEKDGKVVPRFGDNNDYIAYFGDTPDGSLGGFYGGGSTSGWFFVNHEYVSGTMAAVNTPPAGSYTKLAEWMRARKLLNFDTAAGASWTQANVDKFVTAGKRQIGGSWVRTVQDPSTGQWVIDRAATNVRYDATSATRIKVTGMALSAGNTDDSGVALPAGVVAGTGNNCSGGHTPWGTVLSGEENVQDFYGDLEDCWSGNNTFVAGGVCDPGKNIVFNVSPTASSEYGRASKGNNRDYYGYLVEFDPGKPADKFYDDMGVGHQKLGSFGRARWENAAVATDGSWQLVPGKPIVIYASSDRRGGRLYKWVSKTPYTAGMTKKQIRDMLADGYIYVAHFADLDNNTGKTINNGTTPTAAAPGNGKWILLSVDNSTDDAPNAPALGAGIKVGAALKNNTWNGLGAIPDNNTMKQSLFTAEHKIGVRELNRPEDIEWSPSQNRLYIAFTNHTGNNFLFADGKLDTRDNAAKRGETVGQPANRRNDAPGSVFALKETGDDFANVGAFQFYAVWLGDNKKGLFDAGAPDNLVIDPEGNLWFGTDGNPSVNGSHGDGLYYVDMTTTLPNGTHRGFRVVAGPSDSEATGPAFTPDGRTLFFNVQHPGEARFSNWPWSQP